MTPSSRIVLSRPRFISRERNFVLMQACNRGVKANYLVACYSDRSRYQCAHKNKQRASESRDFAAEGRISRRVTTGEFSVPRVIRV